MLQTCKWRSVHHLNVVRDPNPPSPGRLIRNQMTKLQAIQKNKSFCQLLNRHSHYSSEGNCIKPAKPFVAL